MMREASRRHYGDYLLKGRVSKATQPSSAQFWGPGLWRRAAMGAHSGQLGGEARLGAGSPRSGCPVLGIAAGLPALPSPRQSSRVPPLSPPLPSTAREAGRSPPAPLRGPMRSRQPARPSATSPKPTQAVAEQFVRPGASVQIHGGARSAGGGFPAGQPQEGWAEAGRGPVTGALRGRLFLANLSLESLSTCSEAAGHWLRRSGLPLVEEVAPSPRVLVRVGTPLGR